MQIGFQGLGRLVALSLNVATFAVILSGLSPAGYGQAALALTLADVVGTIAAFGIDTTVFRGLSIGSMGRDGFGTAILLRLGLATCAGTLGVLAVLWVPDPDFRTALIVAFASMPVGVLPIFHQVLRARVRLIPFALADIGSSALALTSVVLFSLQGLSPADVVLSTVLSNAIVWVALAVASCRLLRPGFTAAGTGRRLRALVGQARMLALGDATVVAYYRADIVALGLTTGGAALGIYAAAYRFVDIAMYAQVIVIGAYFPRIARAWADPSALRRLLAELTGVLLALATVAFIAVVTLGPAVIGFFGGSSYGDITVLVGILMAATTVMFLNRLSIQTLIAGGFAGRQALCWLGGVTGALLAFPLSAAYAERGTAAAMLIGEVLILLTAMVQLRTLGALPRIRPRHAWVLGLAVSAAAAVPIAELPDAARVPAGVALALGVAGGLLLALRRRGLSPEGAA